VAEHLLSHTSARARLDRCIHTTLVALVTLPDTAMCRLCVDQLQHHIVAVAVVHCSDLFVLNLYSDTCYVACAAVIEYTQHYTTTRKVINTHHTFAQAHISRKATLTTVAQHLSSRHNAAHSNLTHVAIAQREQEASL
jgi:hypothetical protein